MGGCGASGFTVHYKLCIYNNSVRTIGADTPCYSPVHVVQRASQTTHEAQYSCSSTCCTWRQKQTNNVGFTHAQHARHGQGAVDHDCTNTCLGNKQRTEQDVHCLASFGCDCGILFIAAGRAAGFQHLVQPDDFRDSFSSLTFPQVKALPLYHLHGEMHESSHVRMCASIILRCPRHGEMHDSLLYLLL